MNILLPLNNPGPLSMFRTVRFACLPVLCMMLATSGFPVFAQTRDEGQLKASLTATSAEEDTAGKEQLQQALQAAGENRTELLMAISKSPAAHREAMEFLIANMPERDLRSLSSEYLLENVRLAYEAWEQAPWKTDVPHDIFLNNVLPYANINERRDGWRRQFMEQFRPLIAEASTPSHAAALLNQKLFPLVKVKYSTQRPKADQSPLESINAGLASCTGLSVLLIDACRALGIPARFVGTPLWSDNSGNHSWVEIWDNGWHFTGAAEPTGNNLDKAWFSGRAGTAVTDDPNHAIYAVSFRRTPLRFPLVWDRSIDYVSAVNVTNRYVAQAEKVPDGMVLAMFCVKDRRDQKRISARVRVLNNRNENVFEGISRDEGFDTNDYLQTFLQQGEQYRVTIRCDDIEQAETIRAENRSGPWIWTIARSGGSSAATRSAKAVADLVAFLSQPTDQRPDIQRQEFAKVPLTKGDAAEAVALLWSDHQDHIRATRKAETDARELVIGELKMPFDFKVFGTKPPTGRSLYLSLHGGGGAPKRVNDQQWENQKRLYEPAEGLYLAPRAPTDTWNLWHQAHIDQFFDRLIQNLIVLEEVDPNRVYLLGYSAGGDGVYQLAPRMADRFAAAAMMAGHPNETSPLGLRNLPFTLHMGELDTAYNRNKTAVEWQTRLKALQKEDPEGYDHWVHIHAAKSHWMDREDAEAIPWMAGKSRNPLPQKIVWKQDDVVHSRFYWLGTNPQRIRERAEIRAERDGNSFAVKSDDVEEFAVLLNDEIADLDKPITVTHNGIVLHEGMVERTIDAAARSLAERGDPATVFTSQIAVVLSAQP
ncbi:MAG: transglutaminase domain-containing protein [Planctomycetaceae bacterium]